MIASTLGDGLDSLAREVVNLNITHEVGVVIHSRALDVLKHEQQAAALI